MGNLDLKSTFDSSSSGCLYFFMNLSSPVVSISPEGNEQTRVWSRSVRRAWHSTCKLSSSPRFLVGTAAGPLTTSTPQPTQTRRSSCLGLTAVFWEECQAMLRGGWARATQPSTSKGMAREESRQQTRPSCLESTASSSPVVLKTSCASWLPLVSLNSLKRKGFLKEEMLQNCTSPWSLLTASTLCWALMSAEVTPSSMSKQPRCLRSLPDHRITLPLAETVITNEVSVSSWIRITRLRWQGPIQLLSASTSLGSRLFSELSPYSSSSLGYFSAGTASTPRKPSSQASRILVSWWSQIACTARFSPSQQRSSWRGLVVESSSSSSGQNLASHSARPLLQKTMMCFWVSSRERTRLPGPSCSMSQEASSLPVQLDHTQSLFSALRQTLPNSSHTEASSLLVCTDSRGSTMIPLSTPTSRIYKQSFISNISSRSEKESPSTLLLVGLKLICTSDDSLPLRSTKLWLPPSTLRSSTSTTSTLKLGEPQARAKYLLSSEISSCRIYKAQTSLI